jgi:hypothetical protein
MVRPGGGSEGRRRLLWFVGLWAAGVLTVTAVASLLKLLLMLLTR